MKILPWILLIVGAIAVYLLWPQTGTSDRERELDHENTSLLYKIDSMTRVHKASLARLKEDSIQGVKVQDSLKTQGNAFKREVDRLKANPIVIKVREEVPEVDSLIVAQDSVIVLQEHRIAAFEHQLGKLQISMAGITANFESMLSAERERYANSQEIIALKDKELKKEKNKTKGAVAIGIAAIVGVLLIK